MRILVSRSERRPFEVDRFGAAWRRVGGDGGELAFVTPAAPGRDLDPRAFAGVLLTGGPDVEPWRYGAVPQPRVEVHTDPARDLLDLELLALADRHELPVLAVCYGCQLLVVAGGGSLIQDLPAAGFGGHQVNEPKDFLAHDATIERDARFLPHAGRTIRVNSRHHQAAAAVGAAHRVVARAPDGVVEAVEPVGGERFVLGVQWHPENVAHPDHDAVFAAFRAACARRAGEA